MILFSFSHSLSENHQTVERQQENLAPLCLISAYRNRTGEIHAYIFDAALYESQQECLS